MRLNQILAIEKGTKDKTDKGVTAIYQRMEKAPLLSGISRTYRPKTEDGDQLPSEATKVQVLAKDAMKEAFTLWSSLFDVTATKDFANCDARADVTVGDVVLIKQAPVTYLLFLEKRLKDIHTLVSKLPTLDPSEDWSWSENARCFAAPATETHRTKKEPRAFTAAPATDKHPAQVQIFTEDIIVGFWKTIKFSGAMPGDEVKKLTERVETLQRAVKIAREEANGREIETVKVADRIFNYLLG